MGQAHDRPVDAIRDAITAWGGRPLVIAVDGRSGAGKSTLARQPLATIDATLVEGDLFYRDMPDDQRAALTPQEGVANYFDWERLRDQALVPLRRGEAAWFRPFDWRRAAGLASPVVVLPRPVVIVEGVYSARPEFDGLVDLGVLVETDEGERRQRLGRRIHDLAGWKARWEAAEEVYFTRVRLPGSFDLRVCGSAARPT
jgi:uridine kinase